MATSSKVLFRLETLKEKALESIDFRISQKEQEIASYFDEEAMNSLVNQWRARQEERISDLFRRLGEDGISNAELAKFKVSPMPEIDEFEMRRAQRDLQSLVVTRSKIEAKADSLVPDKDGSISLTKTQLQEFFGL